MKITHDAIEDSLLLAAPLDRVWDALTNPAQIAKWFCSAGVEGQIEVGKEAVLCFANDRCRIRTERLEPKHTFAYRWVPAEASDKPITDTGTTLVTFTLAAVPGGTELNMVESGIAALGEQSRRAFFFNGEGWDEVLEGFEKFVREPNALPDAMHFRISVDAPIDRVWRALSDKSEAAKAFGCDACEGEIAPGSDVFIVMGESRQRMHYEDLIAPRFLSYRWVPGQFSEEPVNPDNSTLVSFNLVHLDGKTILMVREEGFAKLGVAGSKAFELNTEGWGAEVLPHFKTYVEEHERAQA